jgi:hypothetical protein
VLDFWRSLALSYMWSSPEELYHGVVLQLQEDGSCSVVSSAGRL